MNDRRRTSILFSVWVPLLVAFVLRITLLGYESLWDDEVITVIDSLKPVSTIVNQRWDPHPPLYYLLLHYWLQINHSDAFSRLPSVIFGTLSVFLIYLIGLRLTTRRAAWFMALLLAVAPLHIWYSQETRMYALVALLALASTYLWILLLQDRYHHLWMWVGYVLATSGGMYTHYTMAMIIIGQNIFTLARWAAWVENRRNYPLKYWLISQLALVLLYWPWAAQLPKHWGVIRSSTGYPLWELSTTPALVGIAVGGLLLMIVLALWQRRVLLLPDWLNRSVVTAVLSVTLVLFLLFLALALTNRLTTFKRQTLVLFPFLYVFLLYLLAKYVPKWPYWVAGLLVISFIVACFNLFTLQKPPWRETVALIQSQADPADALVFYPPWLNTTFRHHLQQAAQTAQDAPTSETVPLSREYETIWLVVNTKIEQGQDPNATVRNWLITHYEQETSTTLGELEVVRFQHSSR